MLVKGKDIRESDILDIRKLGVSYIPEDRMHQGIASDASIADNLLSTQYRTKAMNKGPFKWITNCQACSITCRRI